MHRLCFSTLACPAWGWIETARRAAEYRFDGVETRMIAGDVDLLARPELAPSRRAESRRVYADQGVALCGLASSVRFDDQDTTHFRRQLDVGRRTLSLAADLGSEFVRVFGDVLPTDDPSQRRSTMEQIAEGLNRLGEFATAETPGVRVVIETHGDFSDTQLLTELMALVPHPKVGVLWDTHHPWRFHGERLGETLDRLGDRVWHTHWKDSIDAAEIDSSPGIGSATTAAEREAAAERARALMSGHRDANYTLFGAGEFPAAECLRLLEERGYHGWHSLEWEKAWHPELAPPEVALPPFPVRFRALAGGG